MKLLDDTSILARARGQEWVANLVTKSLEAFSFTSQGLNVVSGVGQALHGNELEH